MTSPVEGRSAAGFVLAGGHSRRMGSDKALADFSGKPLIVNALKIFIEAGLEVLIAGARSPLGSFAPVIDDGEHGDEVDRGRGPLAGICAGLAATEREFGVFLPVDMPLMPASLLAYMVDYARTTDSLVTLASVNGYTQTFPVVVSQTALPQLRARLDAGQGGCFAAFQVTAKELGGKVAVLPVELLVQTGQVPHPESLPAAYWFQNVNTREELAQAQTLVRRPIRVS